ncbi:putative bZIP transcription factor [Aspergillus ambiguus]|uniref:putative bZIP transcription factor (MetR) n=1 Tax=Aspergillus ambiguus TaxID=176160 RepID=UPI003CCE01AE
MSEFNGRRAPNFSQYLEDLNAIPSPYDQALQQQQQQQDVFNLDAELSMFTNTEFFDFDHLGDLNLPTFNSVDGDSLKTENKPTAGNNTDMEFLDLLGDGLGSMPDYSASDFNTLNPQSQPQAQSQPPKQTSTQKAVQDASFSTIPQIPGGSLASKPAPSQSAPQTSVSPTEPSAPGATAAAPTPAPASSGPKRKNTQKTPPMSVEEAARIAAEEDKRRRNTAASARFRVKKKMREQALEKTVKETTEKNAALEARVTALELENQWLKNLITEKNGKSATETKKSESDIANMFKKFLATHAENQRSSSDSKIGVGTLE